MKNKIQDLRDHLFATIEGLLDPEHPLPIDRAQAIADVAQVIVNSAKVEVDFLKVTDRTNGSGFIPDQIEKPALPEQNYVGKPRLVGQG